MFCPGTTTKICFDISRTTKNQNHKTATHKVTQEIMMRGQNQTTYLSFCQQMIKEIKWKKTQSHLRDNLERKE